MTWRIQLITEDARSTTTYRHVFETFVIECIPIHLFLCIYNLHKNEILHTQKKFSAEVKKVGAHVMETKTVKLRIKTSDLCRQ